MDNEQETEQEQEQDFVPLVCCGVDTMLDMSVQQGEALDVIMVNAVDPSAPPSCSDFLVQFSGIGDACSVRITINGQPCPGMDMKVTDKGCRFVQGGSLKPPADALQAARVHLLHGKNSIRYSLLDDNNDDNHLLVARAEANLFLWNHNYRVIVCDIDGTITKSNARGVLDTMVLESYVYIHDGVTNFLSNLLRTNDCLRIMYLTSRPVSYAQTTRKFLSGLRQGTDKLPEGPLFLHPGTLSSVLLSELVMKDVHVYKSDALLRQVVLTFAAAGRPCTTDLLVAGFGNTLTDSVAYEMAGIRRHDIYVIDKQSRISCMDKDVDTTLILDKVRVNSQGSVVVKEDSQTTLLTQDSSVVTSQHHMEASASASSSRPSSIRRHGRSYATLIGSSYSGYHDPELLEDVKEKMVQVRP
jgi:phosphatidate phosphatase PAH1